MQYPLLVNEPSRHHALPSGGSGPPPPRNDKRSTSDEDVAKGGRVLVVEDDFLISLQMEQALVAAGFEVVMAHSGEEALALAAERGPAMVVMDIRLGGAMDGVDTALALFGTLGLRSIFATAHSDADARARAEPAQPAGWLSKPYSMPTLVAAVRAALDD